jgi:hypothetical protein
MIKTDDNGPPPLLDASFSDSDDNESIHNDGPPFLLHESVFNSDNDDHAVVLHNRTYNYLPDTAVSFNEIYQQVELQSRSHVPLHMTYSTEYQTRGSQHVHLMFRLTSLEALHVDIIDTYLSTTCAVKTPTETPTK